MQVQEMIAMRSFTPAQSISVFANVADISFKVMYRFHMCRHEMSYLSMHQACCSYYFFIPEWLDVGYVEPLLRLPAIRYTVLSAARGTCMECYAAAFKTITWAQN